MVKKIISAAAAIMLAVGLTSASFANEYGSVVVLGDSIASGYGLEGYESGNNYSAADSFGSLISADCSEYSNFAVDGRTSGELLAAFEGDISGAVTACDSVVISIGGNDFLQPMLSAIQSAIIDNTELIDSITEGTLSPEEIIPQISAQILEAADAVDISRTAENIDGIMGKIREANPESDIYILTVYNPFENAEGMEDFSSMAVDKLSQLNSAIKDAAASNGANIIDVYSAFLGHANDYTNISRMDIHPSKEGHGVIYGLLKDAMESSLAVSADLSNSGDGSIASAKPVPDTGAPEIIAAFGVSALAAAGIILARRKRG